MKDRIYNAMPFVLLISGLVLTFLFYQNEIRWHELNQRIFYKDHLDRIQQNILYRLQTYVDEQIAAGAFISSSEVVKRDEWRDFVNALKLDRNYPGINGLGYAVPVKKTDSLAFVLENRHNNSRNFKISGLNQVRGAKEFFVIKYLEPYYRNIQAIGFDMGSEPIRRAAMEKARNTGKAAVSERVILVQDHSKSAGFLIYVPIYRAETADTAGRQFLGWAYAPFIAESFMKGVLKRELQVKEPPYEIELYDGAKSDTSKLLYRSWVVRPDQTDSTYQSSFPVYGNQWTLRVLPTKHFEAAKGKTLAYFILIGGILLNFALFFLLRALANTRKNAVELAGKMTVELRELNQNLDRKVAERTQELADKNRQLSNFAESLKNAYEDLEVKVKFRNLQLEKQVKALQEELAKFKNPNG